MNAIALIGLSGSGKSTVGPLLAERLGLPHLDVDLVLEQREGRTIREIFDTDGEPYFRALEREITIELLAAPGVLSLGGGAPMTRAIADALDGHPVVWLRVEPESSAQRIGRDEGRPLLAGQDAVVRLRKMLSERAPTYARLASLAVDTDHASVDSVVDAVAAHVASFEPGRYIGEVIPVTADKPYEVRVGRGVSFELSQALGPRSRVAIIHTASLTREARRLGSTLDSDVVFIEVPAGREAKRPQTLTMAWRRLSRAGLTRDDAVVGFGEGPTIELAGFVAATWLRGIDFVSVPTTLLAMVDTAIGGKTGIDIGSGGDVAGAFWEPAAALCDMDHLTDLGPESLRGGMAEMAKHGFVADPRTLHLLETRTQRMFDPESQELAEAVARSIRIKTSIVSKDLRESRSEGTRVGRELLNYGHTLGRAVERHSGWGHGEAVSVGIIYAATLSRLLGRSSRAFAERQQTLLERLGLPTRYRGDVWPALRRAMNKDKKTHGTALRFVLLEDVAKPRIEVAPPEDVLRAAYGEVSD